MAGAFRALVHDVSVRCKYEDMDDLPPLNFTFFAAPLSAFGPVLRDSPRAAYTALPGIPAEPGMVVDRFTDDYLVYGALGFSRYLPEREEPLDTQVVAVPVRSPADARVLTVPHNVIRAEQAGDDVVLTGYRGEGGLHVSLIELSGPPRLASTHRFGGRYEPIEGHGGSAQTRGAPSVAAHLSHVRVDRETGEVEL